mmetsp:Transcript_30572/g.27778  ORF Transcript_30572/g.27778 Transcript_30572/m.27778 type:complete len:124 (+) Transcript_30572:508-879(+)
MSSVEPYKKDKFKIIFPKKTYKLKAKSEAIRNEWVEAINEVSKMLANQELRKIMDNEVFQTITGDKLFEDKEEEWCPDPDDLEKLLTRVEAPKKTPPKKVEENLNQDMKRRISLKFDDLPIVN